MPWTDVFLPVEAKYRDAVMQDTWGHLAPKKNTTYRGRIVYAIGCFENGELNPTPIVCEFGGLDDSPWFYDAQQRLLDSFREENVAGCVYEWAGSFRNYVFRGKRRLLTNFNGGAS